MLERHWKLFCSVQITKPSAPCSFTKVVCHFSWEKTDTVVKSRSFPCCLFLAKQLPAACCHFCHFKLARKPWQVWNEYYINDHHHSCWKSSETLDSHPHHIESISWKTLLFIYRGNLFSWLIGTVCIVHKSRAQRHWTRLFVPDGLLHLVWIPGTDDANQGTCLGVLLHLHDGALCRLEDGRLVDVRNADPHNRLVSEGTQVHKAWVYVLVDGLHHNVVSALALKVQWLKKKRRIKKVIKQKQERERHYL